MILKNINKTYTSLLVLSLIVLGACNNLATDSAVQVACVQPGGASAAIPTNLQELALSEKSQSLSLIIKVKSTADEFEVIREALVLAHSPVAGRLGKMLIHVINSELISIEVPKESPALQWIEEKVAAKEILYVEPDYQTFLIQPSITSLFNDPGLYKQWAQNKMQVYNAWNTTRGNSNLVVAVIDTGVDYTHPDLKNSMWRNPREVLNGIDDDGNGYIDDIYGYDFANNDRIPMADDVGTYHGTHVAGTIAATLNNQVGGAGVAPGVKIMALKYLDKYGSGKTSNAIRAIEYAIRNGAKILSNSWGSLGRSQALQDAIEKARQKNILFVAAAGNGDYYGNGINLERTPFYPAAFPNDNIVSVAASDLYDNLTKWSNFGITSVDVAAPGLSIWSTRNGNTYAYLSGTSMATPAVSGVLGLIWSANPALKYSEVKNILLASVDKIAAMKTKIRSGGRVNAARAVLMASSKYTSLEESPPEIVPGAPATAEQCLP